jgi:hypothetical protein
MIGGSGLSAEDPGVSDTVIPPYRDGPLLVRAAGVRPS